MANEPVMINWELVEPEFEWDGSWRDIYVTGTSKLEWQRMIDSLRSSSYQHQYRRGGEASELPLDVDLAFAASHAEGALLQVTFAGVSANCHFFGIGEIEFDIDPRDVTGQEALVALIKFMRFLAQATKKKVILTPENFPELAVLRVDAGRSDVEYFLWEDGRRIKRISAPLEGEEFPGNPSLTL